jgi:uncharacterized radical SAM superfamily Fe-S cluster-containing enzyme
VGARSIAADGRVSSCYFRTTVDGDRRKALVQIDERCNLCCAHCFVSATKQGQTMGSCVSSPSSTAPSMC